MRNTFFDNNFKTIDMKVEIHSVAELKEFRDKLTEIINLAEDLGLEIEDYDNSNQLAELKAKLDDKEDISDNEVRAIGKNNKEELRSIYRIILGIIKSRNLYRPDICATTGKPGEFIASTEEYSIYFDAHDGTFYIKGISGKEAVEIFHMVDDYFDEIEK